MRTIGRRAAGPNALDAGSDNRLQRGARVLGRLEQLGARGVAVRTAAEFGVPLGRVLQGESRSRNVIRARHRVWCLLRHTLDVSYPEMAEIFEADHTTIVVAVRKRERELGGPAASAGA
jgi:chromosomal replication initiation ATPase DnaA